MKELFFKMTMFLAAFVYIQLGVIPWILTHDNIPLWADVTLITLVLAGWVAFVENIANRIWKGEAQ